MGRKRKVTRKADAAICDEIVLKGVYQHKDGMDTDMDIRLRLVPESNNAYRLEIQRKGGDGWMLRVDESGNVSMCGTLDMSHNALINVSKIATEGGEIVLDEPATVSDFVKQGGRDGGQKIVGGTGPEDKLELDSPSGVTVSGVDISHGRVIIGGKDLSELFAPLTVNGAISDLRKELAGISSRVGRLESNTVSDRGERREGRRDGT